MAGLPAPPGPATPLAPTCPKLVSAVRMRYISASLGSREPRPGPAEESVCEETPLEVPPDAPFPATALPFSAAPDAPPLAGPPVEPIADPGASAPFDPCAAAVLCKSF